MGDLDRPVERVRIDRVVVVLAGDLDRAGREMSDGVVPAVMTERQFERRAAERMAEDLVAETDSEERDPRYPRGSRTASAAPTTAAGSPGPFERKMPSGVRAITSAALVEAGTTSTKQPALARSAQDRVLDAEVVRDHVERRVGVAARVRLRRSSRLPPDPGRRSGGSVSPRRAPRPRRSRTLRAPRRDRGGDGSVAGCRSP